MWSFCGDPSCRLPRRAALADPTLPDSSPNPTSGLGRLADFSVISELKVTATQIEGQDYGEVTRDFIKLSHILNVAEQTHPQRPLPAAFVGVLCNQRRKVNFDLLQTKVDAAGARKDVRLLKHIVEW